ncbi:CRM-domain containing factor CFM2, chloroplastic-like [Musa acuminata AAA Group]|uniref:CRM-domain containing factor CFM2, chloroplastic-like n=1 Tax=Musa acuminata AAA Group TaxID=214697 RepID=UPI0031DDD1B4
MFLSHPVPISLSSTSSSSKAPFFQSPPFLPPFTPRSALRSQNPRKRLKEVHLRTSNPTPETLAKSAIQRISEKLRSLGYLENGPATAADRPATGRGSAGEIFIPTSREIPSRRVGYTIDSSWSTPEHPVPEPGSGVTINRFGDLWRREKERQAAARATKDAAAPPMVAELTIPPEELKRLRREGVRLAKRLKVGKAGITEGIVNGIHERWRRSELVKIKCEDLCRMNMKRTHEILERKTGGLVIWRSGSIIILYRGVNYKYPYYYDGDKKNEIFDEVSLPSGLYNEETNKQEVNSPKMISANSSAESPTAPARSLLVVGVGSPKKVRVQLEGEVQLEEEADRLLDGLGPRFTDWWGCDPLPVDADLLPAVVPGFRKPLRLIPFGIKPKLTDREMTILRRLGRPLPCHFALGRSRNLQGLAVSMIKLWERCEIAKIAVKRGVQNTNSIMMAEELKQLTGGTLLSRDKEFIVFYRGKDFLPPAVSIAIEERRNYGSNKQKRNSDENHPVASINVSETKISKITLPDEPKEGAEQIRNFALESRKTSVNVAFQRMETRLSQAIKKKEKAEKFISELEPLVEPPKFEVDKEAISEEERYMLRKIGLRMKPFLLLGRRGVFDGTVENMHLHWKYRELVKIISKDRCIKNIETAARILEAESGGILVAVERVSKGYAIIVYRGKNYQRPVTLRPTTLLNRREAMKHSLEAQRCESLKLHVLNISRNLNQMKHQMVQDDSLIDSVAVDKCMTSSNVIATTDETGFGEMEDNNSVDCEGVHDTDSEPLHVGESSDITNDMKRSVSTAFDETDYSSSESSSKDKLIDLKHKDNHSDTKVAQFVLEQRAPVSSSVMGDSPVAEDTSVKEAYVEVPFKAAPLSNRERLVLRKQALKMKKRPVLAVGRNNIISGVAKTIRTHFMKYPLAIVNIKGRAKGTSVQELIFELEQATGSVLVSREPNKVILYRGWGEGESPGGVRERDAKPSGVQEIVSPQLIEAIRLECGFHSTT